MLNMLATLAEYERELIVERVNAGIAAARQNGVRFGRPVSDPAVIADKLAIAQDAARRGAPQKAPPASSAGAARRSTDTSKRRPSLSPNVGQQMLVVPRSYSFGGAAFRVTVTWVVTARV